MADDWKARNKDKVREYNKRYWAEKGGAKHNGRKRNQKRDPEAYRDWFRKSRYGITREEWDALFEAQGGRCAICGMEKKLHVDHCHETGKVRGLLCIGCNTSLGKLHNNPELLRKAARYLEK